MDMEKQLAVQSFCFRGFEENEKVAAMVKEIGLSAIEICAKHADFSTESTFDDVIKIYADAGVRIISIGVNRVTGEEKAARKYFEFVKKAGAEHISVDFAPDTLEKGIDVIDKLTAEYGVKAGIHNHGGRHWLGNAQMLGHVFSRSSEALGLCLDTAWAMHAHEDPMDLVEKFKDRLTAIHFKDFVFDRSGNHQDVVAGTGNLDLPAMISLLDEKEFTGPAIIEYEADVDAPVPALTECVNAIIRAEPGK